MDWTDMDWSVLSGSGVRVSRLALGTATFGVAPTKGEARALVDAESAEEILGEALGARRAEVILASKVSERVGGGPNDFGLGRPHVIRMLERSLSRLRTDYLDIYYAHHPDPGTDIAEREVLPAARRFGLSTTVFSPRGGGLSADGMRDRVYSGDARWGGRGFTENERSLAARVAKLGAE
jgi:aryl-alcohol dehydrogenase-like predicted oxidoreductase